VTAPTILGQPAVPAIIRRLDDRREMAVQQIVFENRFAGAFEAVRQVGALRVVDCLDLIINGLTGEHFGQIASIGVGDLDRPEFDAERKAIVAGSRGYLARKEAMPRVPSKSLPRAG
jgi:hypothetical protein